MTWVPCDCWVGERLGTEQAGKGLGMSVGNSPTRVGEFILRSTSAHANLGNVVY